MRRVWGLDETRGGQHTSSQCSAAGLRGGRLPVTDTGIYVPQASHWEVWVCRPKLRDGSVLSSKVRGMADTGIIDEYLLLGVCTVVLVLLLMAGDVERNPGPTGKEGS